MSVESKIKFVENFYKTEIEDLKKRGNLNSFNINRINKGYKKDLASAKKDKDFENIFMQEAYIVSQKTGEKI